MVWAKVSSLFRSSTQPDDMIFLKNLKTQPLSQTCYILWFYYYKSKSTQLAYKTAPFRYIFRFENKYQLYGNNVFHFKKKVRWFKTNIVLIFENKSLWSEIQDLFYNFRSIETNEVSDIYNTYIAYRITKKTFKPKRLDNPSIVKLPTKDIPIPKRYRHLKGGLSYGYIKDKKVVSFSAAPHIVNDAQNSYAILRGIETRELEKRQGYAYVTLSKLLDDLFTITNVKEVFLWVENNNTPAKNLYTKMGFVPQSEIFATYCDTNF
ncbi:MAG: GNAT family N-acetyltransferase [Candidatus Hodarchaeales archaeon]